MAGLARVHTFFLEVDADAAQRAIEAIAAATDLLADFPQAGRPADDLEPGHRELLIPFGVSGYVPVYTQWADTIIILALRHQREAAYPD